MWSNRAFLYWVVPLGIHGGETISAPRILPPLPHYKHHLLWGIVMPQSIWHVGLCSPSLLLG